MTNKEIRFELAKIALARSTFMASESIIETTKNLYEWITDESETKDEKSMTDYDDEPIGKIIVAIGKSERMGSTYATKLATLFRNNGIHTVGDLLREGGRCFSNYKNVGKGSISRIDDALEELYGIKNWYKS